MARAEAAGADAIAVFTAATDAFTQANIGMTVEESLAAFAPVLARAGDLGWWRRGYVSTAFGCPYTGAVMPARAVEVAAPAARPRRRRGLLRRHDRRRRARPGRGPDRRWPSRPASRSSGSPSTSTTRAAPRWRTSRPAWTPASAASTASTGGTGGCPYAPGAAGNLATEDLVYFLDASGWEHGVSLDGRPRGGPVHRRRARPAARDQGRPGRRLGPGDGGRDRALTRPSRARPASEHEPGLCYRPRRWTVSYSF